MLGSTQTALFRLPHRARPGTVFKLLLPNFRCTGPRLSTVQTIVGATQYLPGILPTIASMHRAVGSDAALLDRKRQQRL